MPKIQYTIRIEESTMERAKVIANKQVRSLNNLFEYYITKGVEFHESESSGPFPFVYNDED